MNQQQEEGKFKVRLCSCVLVLSRILVVRVGVAASSACVVLSCKIQCEHGKMDEE